MLSFLWLLTDLELSKNRATRSALRSQALEFSPHLAIFFLFFKDGFWGSNSGPHDCKVSIFLTEASPHLSVF